MSQAIRQACPNKELQDYLEKEFETIKSNPTYALHNRCGNLKIFEEDMLFHIRAPIPAFFEWTILSFNRLRLNTKHIATRGLRAYLDQEFIAIQNDPTYRAHIASGYLKVLDGVKLFHITTTLGCWLEWRILSYNELMRAHPQNAGSSSNSRYN